MKAKAVIAIILISGLSAASYWFYYKKESNSTIQELIPETSLFTFQGDGLTNDIKELNEFKWSETLMSSPFLKDLRLWGDRLDSLHASSELRSDIGSLPYWISFHTTANDAISPLFFLESSGFEWNRESIIILLNSITGKGFSFENQEYNGFELLNLSSDSMELVLLIQGQFLIFSEKNVLVEDVVRAIENEDSRLISPEINWRSSNKFQLMLNTGRLKELHDVFFTNSSTQYKKYGDVAVLDLMFNNEGIQLLGRSFQSEAFSSNAELIAKNLIPNSSTGFQWLGIEVGIEKLKGLITNDLLKLSLDMNFNDLATVLVLDAVDTTQLHDELKNIADENLEELDSAAYDENYLTIELGYIQNDKFISELTSDLVSMNSPYYAVYQNSLILSDNLEALKNVMDDYDAEDTWGRSVEKRRILDDLIQETDLTIINEFQYANESLIDNLKPKWHKFAEENPQFVSILNRLIVQLNSTEQGYLIASEISFDLDTSLPSNLNQVVSDRLNVVANVFADSTLVSKPYVVRNHNNGALEVIFQDMAGDIYLSSRQGEVLWKMGLRSSIQGPIHQVDYYNNKKLQYLFFTDSLIHLIDRNGEFVEGFPKAYQSDLNLEGTRVIDYDNSKRYRYLAVDRRGNVSLYNKEGEILEGWDPLRVNAELIQTPFHTRVRGRDVFVITSTTGSLTLLNRKGEQYPGFPVEQDMRLRGDVTLIKGPNFESTRLAMIDREGKLVEINFEGSRVTDKQIFRPNLESEFSLVNDVLETGYKIMRNDGESITFFSMTGEEEFSFNHSNSGNVVSDYYNFRNNKEIYVLRDRDRQELMILNRRGEQISAPIPASAQPSILYYQNSAQYEVFVNFTSQMNIYTIDAK